MDLNTAIRILNGEEKLKSEEECKIKQWQDVYVGISLHTTGACPKFKSLDSKGEIIPPNYFGERYQWRFENLLMNRHPREHELTRNWRFSQYKPLTKAPFNQIIEVIIGAIFQDSNYHIDIQNEDDNRYIWSNSFEGYDLIGWYANIGIPNIMEDPNGLIIRMPVRPYYEQSEGKVEIGIYFIKSIDIIWYDGNVLVFRKNGYAYYVDSKVIFRLTKIEEKKWVLAGQDISGYYAHMLGKLPVDVAGGVWNTQGFYDSYLDKAKAPADDYICSYSAEQMVDKEASHPFIIMANEECKECDATGKISQECDDCPDQDYELVDCPKCKGKGTTSISPGDRLTAKKEDMQYDLVKIVNTDVAINTYHHDKNNDIYERILQALQLQKVDKAQSGTAKAIDEENLYKFISKVSNHLFDTSIYNSVHDIIAYRNIGVVNGVVRPVTLPFTVQKPTQFQILTAADLLSEFKTGTESKMPAFIRGQMITEYIDKKYAGDEVMKKQNEIIQELDDLALSTPEEISTMLTFNQIDKTDALFHRKLPSILKVILREKGDGWFLEQRFETIKEEVDKKFEVLKPAAVFNVLPDLA